MATVLKINADVYLASESFEKTKTIYRQQKWNIPVSFFQINPPFYS